MCRLDLTNAFLRPLHHVFRALLLPFRARCTVGQGWKPVFPPKRAQRMLLIQKRASRLHRVNHRKGKGLRRHLEPFQDPLHHSYHLMADQ